MLSPRPFSSDRDPIDELELDYLDRTKAHYDVRGRPHTRDTVFEILEAQFRLVNNTLAHTKYDAKATEFFFDGLAQLIVNGAP